MPVRTSSAPPEEHSKPENKSHFIPTKTGSLHTVRADPVCSYVAIELLLNCGMLVG